MISYVPAHMITNFTLYIIITIIIIIFIIIIIIIIIIAIIIFMLTFVFDRKRFFSKSYLHITT